MEEPTARRLRGLTRTTVLGHRVAVAEGFRARLLGLAGLAREQVGGGLLIPRCASVHTFGMRFALDLLFLDPRLGLLVVHLDVPPARVVGHRGAAAVLELPVRRDCTVR
jgi:hypothetical protein